MPLFRASAGWRWTGVEEAVRVEMGDCFVLPRGRAFRLTNDLGLTPADAFQMFPFPLNGGIATWQGGGACFGVGGHFLLSGKHADVLLGMLPPIVHIRKEADRAAMQWALDRMRQELRDAQPGSVLVAQQLAYTILVQALRLHLAEGLSGGVGWLFALADPQMSAAIHAIHHDPARDWKLQELAERAGMSRSVFALKFKQTVGASPIEYLTRWRMLLAGDKLVNSSDSIASVALSLGYESESAFSTAFKRVMGCSPRQYSRDRDGAVPRRGEEQRPAAHPLQRVAS